MSRPTWFFDLGNTLVANREWLPGAESLLAELASLGIRRGVISNTGSLSRVQLMSLLPDTFSFADFNEDLVILSSEVGIEKPDPRIFLLAIERATAAPEECMFIGEDLRETLAAQNVGMRSARISNSSQDFELLAAVSGGQVPAEI